MYAEHGSTKIEAAYVNQAGFSFQNPSFGGTVRQAILKFAGPSVLFVIVVGSVGSTSHNRQIQAATTLTDPNGSLSCTQVYF
jgi:hypothetical protein